MGSAPHLFLTGLPGCGKTTVIQNVLKEIGPQVPVSGFFTSEIRKDGLRVGFSVRTTAGKVGLLAHVDFKGHYRVGRYGVDVTGFEELVLPCLTPGRYAFYVIDEVGKMECLSEKFCAAVRRLLSREIPVLGTVALRGGGFMAEIRNHPGITLWEVTAANRSILPEKILKKINYPSHQ